MPLFHYRELDELRADIQARGLDMQLVEDVAPLADTMRVGWMSLSNRLVVHPMEGCDGNGDGTPGDLTFRRWRRFAEGGAALIWGEATAVVPEGRANPRQLLISAKTAPELKRLLDETRRAHQERFGSMRGFVVGLQLTHSGRWSADGPIIAEHGAAIDAVKHCENLVVLTDEELERLEDRFEEAATIARDIGFDFVDIKQCHTYLLNELLGSRTRDGRYGGSFENRTRFVRNVFARIRARLGDSLALATRLNVFDSLPYRIGPEGFGVASDTDRPYMHGWGTSIADPLQPDLVEPVALLAELCALGLVMVNVTMGSPYYNPHIGRPFERPPVDGYAPPEHPLVGVERHVRLTAEIQRAHPGLAVVGTGYSWLRHYALQAGAANLEAGRVSLVGLGRGALAYPDFAVDALEGSGMSANKACIGVSYCTALMRAKHHPLGQFPAGCVPRDPSYAEEFRAARKAEGW
jgi:2,4-dienoyl-CoA reductase-like NADH-dependent reductase (Old Yellow Enzyme family)